jgi:hypothetical protein
MPDKGVFSISITTRTLIIVLVSAPFVVAPQSIAGTGGIFSSDNPRRKVQTVVPETPTTLQGAPGSQVSPRNPGFQPVPATSLDNGQPLPNPNSSLPLHGVNSPSTSPGPGDSSLVNPALQGSVESFFQVNSADVFRQSPDFRNDKTTEKLSAELTEEPQRRSKSAIGGSGRFFWHVLDNVGVPMFFGKNDDDLEPTLRRGYPSPTKTDYKSIGGSGSRDLDATNGSATSSPPLNLQPPNPQPPSSHKIPESELNGTSVKDNDQTP